MRGGGGSGQFYNGKLPGSDLPLSIEKFSFLVELCGGVYQLNMAPSYMTMMRVREVSNLAYVDLPTHHQQCEQPLGRLTGYVFDQLMPPTTWHRVWWGCNQVFNILEYNSSLVPFYVAIVFFSSFI